MTSIDEKFAEAILEEGVMDAAFYSSQVDGLKSWSPMELAIHYLEFGERVGLAPSSLFDPGYYLRTNPDLGPLDEPTRHYIEHGRQEGRSGSLASQLILEDLDALAIDEALIPQPAALRSELRYSDALAVALRACDRDLRYFSGKFYLSRHLDLATMTMDPLIHYLKYGHHEGRVTNVSLLTGTHINERLIDDRKPFTIVGVHESSTTGAPIVGMDLARSMIASHNVIFVSLRDGPLIEIAKDLFPIVIVASIYDEDNSFFVDYIDSNYDVGNAIFSSSACVPFIRPLASINCKITCLIHEFLEYMIYARSVIYLCDLLVFSSRQLLKSWQYMLDDVSRDPDTVMILPQPASAENVRAMSKEAARAAVTVATGLDLEGATLVLGAGQVQIRKGTDIFLQIANQLRRDEGKFVVIWIGQQISEFDMVFGVWFHAQMERSRDDAGDLAVHFEPAGPLYPVLMDAADVFLVTSRLDPLPNVALDAAARNVPVIAFSGATGLADVAEEGQMKLIEVEFAAVDETIAAIKSLKAIS